jgi:hypothetical protein
MQSAFRVAVLTSVFGRAPLRDGFEGVQGGTKGDGAFLTSIRRGMSATGEDARPRVVDVFGSLGVPTSDFHDVGALRSAFRVAVLTSVFGRAPLRDGFEGVQGGTKKDGEFITSARGYANMKGEGIRPRVGDIWKVQGIDIG